MTDEQICTHCFGPIQMMCRLNTGFCSEACEESFEALDQLPLDERVRNGL